MQIQLPTRHHHRTCNGDLTFSLSKNITDFLTETCFSSLSHPVNDNFRLSSSSDTKQQLSSLFSHATVDPWAHPPVLTFKTRPRSSHPRPAAALMRFLQLASAWSLTRSQCSWISGKDQNLDRLQSVRDRENSEDFWGRGGYRSLRKNRESH